MSNFGRFVLAPLALSALLCTRVWSGVGESAVITLVFPPGARATGLGEAFTGLSDDANATFFNPAGLGQPPQANSWHVHLDKEDYNLTAIASKKKKGFVIKERIWAGTQKGLLRYNGKVWETAETYLIEEGDDLRSIAERFLDSDDEALIRKAILTLKKENKVGMKHYRALRRLLTQELAAQPQESSPDISQQSEQTVTEDTVASAHAEPADTENAGDSAADSAGLAADADSTSDSIVVHADSLSPADSLADSATAAETKIAEQPANAPPVDDDVEAKRLSEAQREELIDDLLFRLTNLDKIDRNETQIYGIIANKVDSADADRLAKQIEEILAVEDTEFSELVEVRVPFTMTVQDSITTLAIDNSDQLWVGTKRGLWRYDGSSWNRYTVLDGLPSNDIRCIAVGGYGMVAVGTDNGYAVLSEGLWTSYTPEDGLPDPVITALTFAEDSLVYVGTPSGLVLKDNGTWVTFDTADGLLSPRVSALMYDEDQRLWVGGENGVAVYDRISWKRFKFPNSQVYDIEEYGSRKVWIATNRGAITYRRGRTRTDDQGNVQEDPPQWKAFHSKNALKGNEVRDVAVYGKDVWLVSNEAANHYDYAEKQVMFFWEPLLPAFNIPDLWHTYFSFVWPTEDWGTVALAINYINMGVNEWTDELGRTLGKARSWEGIFGLCYGLGIQEDFSLGLNVKYVQSSLAPGIGPRNEGVGRTFAIDAALLKRNLLVKGLDLGVNIQNMGPSIFYISREQADPIPFTPRVGLAYRAVETPIHDLKFVMDIYREIVQNYFEKRPDPFYKALYTSLFRIEGYEDMNRKEKREARWDKLEQEIEETQLSLGVEYWYVNFLALRTGFLFDWIGERYEWTFGLGLKYSNINFDWSYIHAPEGFLKRPLKALDDDKTGATGARNGQWRLSFIIRF